MKKLNKITSLGFNIYKTNFNADFIPGLIKKYGLNKSLRLGIASPLLGQKNTHIPAGMHGKIAEKIVRLGKICDAKNISINFDCGFTLCSFSPKQLGKLFYYNAMFSSHCQGAIDIGPNLEIWRCFATSGLWAKKLGDFRNLSGVKSFYEKKFDPFKLVGLKKECLNCKYLMRRQCSGGCLTHALASFKIDKRSLML
jgi:radical SAM protein with 4Fe4S-binding SPASM domain